MISKISIALSYRGGRKMDLRLLKYFVTVVESASYTAAAEILHISQPSLSNAIKQLESGLAITLIDRTKRNMKLTEEGRILYVESLQLLNHFDYVTNEMERLRIEGPPELSIGVIESANYWIPKVLKEFKQEFTNVDIKLLNVLGLKDVEQALNNYDVHVAITNQFLNRDNIQKIPLYVENLVVLLPLEHPLQEKEYMEVKDLENESFIISKEGFQTREDILNTFRQRGIQPNIQFEIGRFDTACSLVENNLGITVVPENYVKYSTSQKFHIRKFNNSSTYRTVYIAFDKNRYLPPLVWRFIEEVKSFFG